MLLQRVSSASATVNKQVVGQIDQGILVLLEVGREDSEVQVSRKTVTNVSMFMVSFTRFLHASFIFTLAFAFTYWPAA